MKAILKSVLLLILSYGCAYAQQPVNDSLLDKMEGKWILNGVIAGGETTHDVTASWVLGHQYIRIDEVSREKDEHGSPVYIAEVFITSLPDGYTCLWLDNTGNTGLSAQAIGHAERKGNKIEFVFNISGQSTFHTTFSYEPDSDTWQWTMSATENGSITPFAQVKLTRDNMK